MDLRSFFTSSGPVNQSTTPPAKVITEKEKENWEQTEYYDSFSDIGNLFIRSQLLQDTISMQLQAKFTVQQRRLWKLFGQLERYIGLVKGLHPKKKLSSLNKALKDKNPDLEAELFACRTQIDDLTAKLRDSEQRCNDKQHRLSQVFKQLTDTRELLSQTEAKEVEAVDQLNALRSLLTSSGGIHHDLSTKGLPSSTVSEELTKKLHESEEEIKLLKSKLEILRQHAWVVGGHTNPPEEKIFQLTSELSNMKHENENLKLQLQSVGDQENELRVLRNKLDSLQKLNWGNSGPMMPRGGSTSTTSTTASSSSSLSLLSTTSSNPINSLENEGINELKKQLSDTLSELQVVKLRLQESENNRKTLLALQFNKEDFDHSQPSHVTDNKKGSNSSESSSSSSSSSHNTGASMASLYFKLEEELRQKTNELGKAFVKIDQEKKWRMEAEEAAIKIEEKRLVLEHELRQSQEEISSLQSRLTAVKEREGIVTGSETIYNLLKTTKLQVKEKEEKMTELSLLLLNSEKEIRGYQNQLQVNDEELRGKNMLVIQLEEKITEMQQKMKTIQIQHQEAIERDYISKVLHEGIIKAKDTQLEVKDTQLEVKDSELMAKISYIKELETKIDSMAARDLEGKILKLEEEKKDSEDRIRRLNDKLVDSNERQMNAINDLEETQTQMKLLSEKFKTSEMYAEELAAELTSLRKRTDSILEMNASLRASLQTNEEKYLNQIQSLSQGRDQLEVEKRQLSTEQKRLQGLVEDLQSRITQQKESTEQGVSKSHQDQEVIRELKGKVDSQRAELEGLRAQMKDVLRAKLEPIAAISNADMEVNALREQLQEHQKISEESTNRLIEINRLKEELRTSQKDSEHLREQLKEIGVFREQLQDWNKSREQLERSEKALQKSPLHTSKKSLLSSASSASLNTDSPPDKATPTTPTSPAVSRDMDVTIVDGEDLDISLSQFSSERGLLSSVKGSSNSDHRYSIMKKNFDLLKEKDNLLREAYALHRQTESNLRDISETLIQSEAKLTITSTQLKDTEVSLSAANDKISNLEEKWKDSESRYNDLNSQYMSSLSQMKEKERLVDELLGTLKEVTADLGKKDMLLKNGDALVIALQTRIKDLENRLKLAEDNAREKEISLHNTANQVETYVIEIATLESKIQKLSLDYQSKEGELLNKLKEVESTLQVTQESLSLKEENLLKMSARDMDQSNREFRSKYEREYHHRIQAESLLVLKQEQIVKFEEQLRNQSEIIQKLETRIKSSKLLLQEKYLSLQQNQILITELQNKIRSYEEELSSKTLQLEQSDVTSRSVTEQLNSQNVTLDELRESLNLIQNKLREVEMEKDTLESKLRTNEIDLNNREETIAEYEEKLGKISKQMREREVSLFEAGKMLEEEKDSLKDDMKNIKNLELKISELEKDLRDKENQLASFQQALSQSDMMAEEAKKLQDFVEVLESENSTLKSGTRHMKERLKDAEERASAYEDKISELEDKLKKAFRTSMKGNESV